MKFNWILIMLFCVTIGVFVSHQLTANSSNKISDKTTFKTPFFGEVSKQTQYKPSDNTPAGSHGWIIDNVDIDKGVLIDANGLSHVTIANSDRLEKDSEPLIKVKDSDNWKIINGEVAKGHTLIEAERTNGFSVVNPKSRDNL